MNGNVMVGFVTDISELQRRARRQRMAVRRTAWSELSDAVAKMAAVVIRYVAGSIRISRRHSACHVEGLVASVTRQLRIC